MEKSKKSNPPKSIIIEKPSQIIKLDSTNGIIEYSDEVILNGNKLIRNKDYLIDYEKSEVKLLNEELFKPDADIKINYQSPKN
jgi:cell surface protein SprA